MSSRRSKTTMGRPKNKGELLDAMATYTKAIDEEKSKQWKATKQLVRMKRKIAAN